MLRRRLMPLFALVVTAGFAVSCTTQAPTEVSKQVSTPTLAIAKAQATPAPTISSAQPTTAPSLERVQAKVTRAIDGDTIEVQINGKTYTVRYIGIDTPETVDPRRPVERMGKEASDKNKELVGGKTVSIEKDVSETDRYGRLLRYVYVDSLFVNAELVRLGYAQASSYPPDVKYQDEFLQMEREARENKRGLWAEETVQPTPQPAPKATVATPRPVQTIVPTVVPTKPAATLVPQPTSTRAPLPTATSLPVAPTVAPKVVGNCDPAYPDFCIPPPPPDLDCKDIPRKRFRVLPPDPHRLDSDRDGIGCES